jgi:hypothetical protein
MLDPHDGQGLAGFTTGNEHPFIPAGESSSVPMPPARRAGIQAASPAMLRSSSAAAATVGGSVDSTPNR